LFFDQRTIFDKERVVATPFPIPHPFSPQFSGFSILGFKQSTNDLTDLWIRTKEPRYYSIFHSSMTIDSLNNTLAVLNLHRINSFSPSSHNYSNNDHFEMFYLDSIGNTLWNRGYRIIDPAAILVTAQKVKLHPSGDFYISGWLNNRGQNADFLVNPNFLTQPFIFKVNKDGIPLNYKRIDKHQFEEIQIGKNGNIYLYGFTFEQEGENTGNEKNAVIMKLDTALNEVWTKIYHADNFEFYRLKMNIGDDGNLYMAYSTAGAFPLIFAKLSSDGEIIWEKGYPFYFPMIDVLSDKSVLILTASHIKDNHELEQKTILTKTDSLGNIPSCETYTTCLNSFDSNTTFGDFDIEVLEVEDLDTLELYYEPIDLGFSDFCENPPAPSPEFEIIDTLCIGDCASTFSPLNKLAHGIKWNIQSDGLDSIIHDSLQLNFCFQESGNYSITQTIWFLGCEYDFQKIITVVEPSFLITPNTVQCGNFPVDISVQANFPINNYEWSTGETTPSISINEITEVSVIINDSICYNNTSTTIQNIERPDCPLDIKLPNIFTPDGDGLNDTFFPLGDHFRVEVIQIYNRWGQKVYSNASPWDGLYDGNTCVTDVYVYYIQYTNLFSNELEEVHGEVTLVR
jgi:gliding motility-associated-like protein